MRRFRPGSTTLPPIYVPTIWLPFVPVVEATGDSNGGDNARRGPIRNLLGFAAAYPFVVLAVRGCFRCLSGRTMLVFGSVGCG